MVTNTDGLAKRPNPYYSDIPCYSPYTCVDVVCIRFGGGGILGEPVLVTTAGIIGTTSGRSAVR